MQRMRWIYLITLLLLIGFILVFAWAGQTLLRLQPPAMLHGLVLLAISTTMFLLLVIWADQHATDTPRTKASNLVTQIIALFNNVPLGMTLVTLGFIYSGATFWLHTRDEMLPWATLAVWITSMSLLLIGASKIDRYLRPRAPAQHTPVFADIDRIEWLSLFTLTVGALLLRQTFIGTIPHNLSGDEAEMGLTARMVLQGDIRDPFSAGWLSHPNLWFFLQALSLRLFGDSVGGLRMVSVLFGTATIPALYLLARLLYGKPTALIAAALLATSHVHIHYSRNALNNIVDPMFGLIASAALFYGIRTRRILPFVLSGCALGLAQHFYMGARLLPIVLLICIIHQIMLHPLLMLRLRWHLLLMFISGIIAFGPLLLFFVSHPHVFNARLNMVGILQSEWFAYQQSLGRSIPDIFLEQIWGGLGAFTFVPDRSAQYDPGIALLDPYASLFFIFGIALLIMRWRRGESVLILSWLVGTAVFGGILLASAPVSPRYVTTIPLLCLVVALTLTQMRTIVERLAPQLRSLSHAMLSGVVVFLALWNINFYFTDYTPRNVFGWINVEVGTEVGLYVRAQPDPVYVYFFGPPRIFWGFGTIRFLAPDAVGADIHEPLSIPDQLAPVPYGYRPLFIFLPEREDELEVVRQRYPSGSLYRVPRRAHDQVLFIGYEPDGGDLRNWGNKNGGDGGIRTRE